MQQGALESAYVFDAFIRPKDRKLATKLHKIVKPQQYISPHKLMHFSIQPK
jgi:hypothetical protein